MAGTDNIKFNTLEKAKSDDWNNAQALLARSVAEILKYSSVVRCSGINLGNASETIVNYCDGLQVVPNGNNVDIQPGFLLQNSNSLTPAVGALDSTYRMAFLRANLTVTALSPVANTYYLLEAQMSEVVALNESRDVLDPTSGNFVATALDKRLERTITTQWKTGTATDYPTPSGGDWFVLAGVFRPAGGGAVAFSHIVDMRNTPGSRVSDREIQGDRSAAPKVSRVAVTADGDSAVFLEADDVPGSFLDAFSDGGHKMWARLLQGGSPAGFDPTQAAVLEPGTVLGANTWYYLYMCPWNNLIPRVYYTNVIARGVLILSPKAPKGFQYTNNAVLNLPDPFGGTIGAGYARCVGILRRNAGNTGWMAQQGGNGAYLFSGQTGGAGASGSGVSVASGSVASNAALNCTDIPGGVQRIRFRVSVALTTFSGAGPAAEVMKVQVGKTGHAAGQEYSVTRFATPGINSGSKITTDIEVPYDSTGYDFYLFPSSITLNAGTMTVYLLGYNT